MSPGKRKVILVCGMSLDGYIARPDGSLDFLDIGLKPADLEDLAAGFYKPVDTLIMGRATFDVVRKMIADGAEPAPDRLKTYVFSRSLPSGILDGATIVKQSPAALVRKLRKQPGKHIYHMGGGQLARSFLAADLIDELLLGIAPVLVGEGIPLFPAGFPQREFKLIKCERFSTDHVSLRYRRIRPKTRNN